MATEDIALAWQLQTAYADVRYEPRALFAMQVPETLPAWWGQRTRWARGLAQVLRENAPIVRDVRARRMWPVWIEGLLSTFWSHLFFLAAGFWTLALATGVYGFGGNPLPNFWGLLIASVLVVQISIGLALDGRYDRSVRRYALWIPLYPAAFREGTTLGVRLRRAGSPLPGSVWPTPRGADRGTRRHGTHASDVHPHPAEADVRAGRRLHGRAAATEGGGRRPPCHGRREQRRAEAHRPVGAVALRPRLRVSCARRGCARGAWPSTSRDRPRAGGPAPSGWSC
jgi:hypothetical protein